MQTPILIIDDDTKLGSLLRDYLEPNGFQVDLSHTGPAGLEQAARRDYAAIILDVMLPGMDGYEVLRALRQRSSTPVLMFTALGEEPDRISGLNDGADDYLPKTYSTTELLARLRALVRRASITEQQRQEREEDRREMEQARDIQRALLPREIPSIEGIDIAGIWKPAKAVGGDYYDVLPIGEGKTAICIGDVSGKGMPAALLMANVQAAVKAFAPQKVSPAELCRRVNRILCGNASDGRYMSFFYGMFNQNDRQFSYTCAGHNPPILIRENNSEVRLTEGGRPLGIFPESDYGIGKVTLGRGDRLVLFTDGVTEATRIDEEFGEERLFGIIRKSGDGSAAALAGSIIDAVSRFSGSTVHDDLTLIALRVVS